MQGLRLIASKPLQARVVVLSFCGEHDHLPFDLFIGVPTGTECYPFIASHSVPVSPPPTSGYGRESDAFSISAPQRTSNYRTAAQ